MNANGDFEERFIQALSQTPDMPDCYGEILRRIKRKRVLARALWGIAASLAISLTFFMFLNGHAPQIVHPDVMEELQTIRSNMNGDSINEELVSCSLIDDEIYY